MYASPVAGNHTRRKHLVTFCGSHKEHIFTVLLLFLTIGTFAANSKSLIHTVSSEHLMFEIFGSKRLSLGDAEKVKGWFMHV